ncbi:hypothetical protein COT12_02495 [Candidatus Berkelbacteria bacterium CG08_land_8_20_14_0_20_39_8]|uniref:Uncharacterized protein n=1 Tax=Candidatus Berkelbacteria bacterium CG08_land_8_20_14_0_20_39_8 TaxID=1974511 RepID=A0A2M6YBV0_9BACT|nr:MAG: hypothetical protein COT12_02495 [Candidatus Berkelbacteria bacterium CG08_land_8_20_14_0_20_39_8]
MLKNYITTDYLFSYAAPQNQRLFLTAVGIFLLFIIISIFLGYNRSIHKGLRSRLFNFFLTIGILGVIVLFFRFESIPYVGSRIVIFALIVVAIIWYFAITIYSFGKMQVEIRAIKNHQRYVQYLPKSKKKK